MNKYGSSVILRERERVGVVTALIGESTAASYISLHKGLSCPSKTDKEAVAVFVVTYGDIVILSASSRLVS